MAAYSGEFCEIKSVSLREYPIPLEVLRLIPERIAKKFQILPLVQLGNTLTMAVTEPMDQRILKLVRRSTQLRVNPLFCTQNDIKDAITYFYSPNRYQAENNFQYSDIFSEADGFIDIHKNPVEKFFVQLLHGAIEKKCSQIIFEFTVSHAKIYLKRLGTQKELKLPAGLPADAVVEYIKRLAKPSNTQQSFWEQQIQLDFDETPISIYLAGIFSAENSIVTLKIHYYGENASLANLGLCHGQMNVLTDILTRPTGALFISAPSEVGKTTTLNAIANYLSDKDRRIIQLSQSVEIPNDEIVQIALQTWNQSNANKIWSLIKQQKPCVLLIDDFYSRDVLRPVLELASDDIFVIFTMPFHRLQQVFHFLQTQKINLIEHQQYYLLRQYLVRQLCDHCKKSAVPDFTDPSHLLFQKGNGCPYCHNTGFQGISGVFEINTLNQNFSFARRNIPDYCTEIINGQPSLFEAGLKKVEKGEIEIEEIIQLR